MEIYYNCSCWCFLRRWIRSISCLWIDFVLKFSASLSNRESVPTVLQHICNSNCSRLAKHVHATPDRLIFYGQVRGSVPKRRKWAGRPTSLQVWSSLWIPSKAFPSELPPAGPREPRYARRSGSACVHHNPDLPQWNIQFLL